MGQKRKKLRDGNILCIHKTSTVSVKKTLKQHAESRLKFLHNRNIFLKRSFKNKELPGSGGEHL